MRNEAIVFGGALLAGAVCAPPAVAREANVKIITTTHKERVSFSAAQKLRY